MKIKKIKFTKENFALVINFNIICSIEFYKFKYRGICK